MLRSQILGNASEPTKCENRSPEHRDFVVSGFAGRLAANYCRVPINIGFLVIFLNRIAETRG
jgi:hypothetical protein